MNSGFFTSVPVVGQKPPFPFVQKPKSTSPFVFKPKEEHLRDRGDFFPRCSKPRVDYYCASDMEMDMILE